MMIAVRKDVLAATGGNQVPWENSSLTRQFEFAPGRGRRRAGDHALAGRGDRPRPGADADLSRPLPGGAARRGRPRLSRRRRPVTPAERNPAPATCRSNPPARWPTRSGTSPSAPGSGRWSRSISTTIPTAATPTRRRRCWPTCRAPTIPTPRRSSSASGSRRIRGTPPPIPPASPCRSSARTPAPRWRPAARRRASARRCRTTPRFSPAPPAPPATGRGDPPLSRRRRGAAISAPWSASG